MDLKKKLYKSRTDKKLCGVCGGLAQYLNVDSSIIRLVLCLLIFCAGVGVLPYFIAALVLDYEPEVAKDEASVPFEE